jgi:hypothetical protein
MRADKEPLKHNTISCLPLQNKTSRIKVHVFTGPSFLLMPVVRRKSRPHAMLLLFETEVTRKILMHIILCP